MHEFTLKIDAAVDQKLRGFETARTLVGYIIEGPQLFIITASRLEKRIGSAMKYIAAGHSQCESLQEAVAESGVVIAQIRPLPDDHLELYVEMGADRYFLALIQASTGTVLRVRERLI